ncbi:MAG: radical SAM protein [Acidilobaceae archaeon]|nr:radical SAM protein [Acidilobaceae archaeon]MCX8165468.1 radical SAM protein [Acidilobaceae archaeon]MDW7973895.1 radical SAM protein [Sulfolobales archaeon]
MRGDERKGLFIGELARGCQLCFPGAKAVIFVTGTCDDACFYCPVSRERLYRDVMWVNEEPVSSLEELVIEVQRMGARGASITGGDPLTALDRVVGVLMALKENLGEDFHVHLYTTGRQATHEALRALRRAGLDEIRFHPTSPAFVKAVGRAREVGLQAGVEIPIAPRMEEWAKGIIERAMKLGASFVNLNEMEIAEPNARALLARGYRESRRRPFVVEGAYEAALRVLEWAQEKGYPVHFCPASFKDSVQTRNRFRRLAELDRRWYEEPTPEGTLRWTEEIGGKRVVVEAHPTRERTRVELGEEPPYD